MTKPKRKTYRVLKVLLAVVVLAAGYIAFDLLAPRESKMRDFNPDEVARLETAMWRSYYSKQQVKLYNQLTELLRSQYNLPLVRSNAVAYQAARAAFVFKDGHNLAELAAELYRVPVERAMEHARLRAEAMTIRDTRAEAGQVTETDWARIDQLLHESWRSLKDAVRL